MFEIASAPNKGLRFSAFQATVFRVSSNSFPRFKQQFSAFQATVFRVSSNSFRLFLHSRSEEKEALVDRCAPAVVGRSG